MTHSAKAFGWDDAPAMRAFVQATAFAHIFVATSETPMVAHAPLLVGIDGSISFHLSRGNRVTRHIDGARILASISADDFYVSPDWYADGHSVPTWNYIAVEIAGEARALNEAETIAQLDALSAQHEARLAPKSPWTRAKMRDGSFETMMLGLRAFAIDEPAWRGTRKLSQNRNAGDRAGVAAALTASGRRHLAELVEIAQ